MNDYSVLGQLRSGRPRPSYVIVADAELKNQAGYPPGNSEDLGNGATMRWLVTQWRSMVANRTTGRVLLEIRNVRVGLFRGETMACYFNVTQTRNSSGVEIPIESFTKLCTAVGFEGAMHGLAAAHAVGALEGRRTLHRMEVITELSELFITPEQKGVKDWCEAIPKMMDRLAGMDTHASVCILNASPLELSACIGVLEEAKAGASRKMLRTIEEQLKVLDGHGLRRTMALQRLYERELGFMPINVMWMCRHMSSKRVKVATVAKARNRVGTAG